MEKVNFLKYIASEASSKPQAAGKILIENLIEDLVKLKGNDFIFEVSEGEAENLDEILGMSYLDTRKKLKRQKRSRNIKRSFVSFAAVIILFLIISSFNYYNNNLIIIGNLTTNETSGSAPLTVQFNDNSQLQRIAFPDLNKLSNEEILQNSISWAFNPKKLLKEESRYWDFGDGGNSTEQSMSHTYSAAGTYTVNLTVSVNNKTNLTTTTITVLDSSS